MSQPPKTLKVLGTTYKVKPFSQDDSALNDRIGECNKHAAIIKYDKTLESTKAANTLLHESLHAIYEEMAMGDASPSDIEEYIVTAFANGIITVLGDNPEFAEWLFANISGD